MPSPRVRINFFEVTHRGVAFEIVEEADPKKVVSYGAYFPSYEIAKWHGLKELKRLHAVGIAVGSLMGWGIRDSLEPDPPFPEVQSLQGFVQTTRRPYATDLDPLLMLNQFDGIKYMKVLG